MSALSSLEFSESLSYALSVLGKADLSLKEEQRDAISAVYGGSDVFVWLPTGFGKSICFQTLPFVFDFKLGFVGAQWKYCFSCSLVDCLDGGPSAEPESQGRKCCHCFFWR